MRMLTFASRNAKEILRDPLTAGFGIGFPVVLILLLSAIQANIPVPLFHISHLSPGVAVFGLSFISLFSATVIAKDRSSALLQRLYTTALTAWDFILGYTLPLLPMALAQSGICYLCAFALGLEPSANILLAMVFILPISLLYIGIGLLCGSVCNEKLVGGVCGALLTNVSAWLSGVWFDLELVGGTFRKIAYGLPFVHAVEMERMLVAGDLQAALGHLWWVLGYGIIAVVAAVLLFLRQMKRH